jgi:hypothetical protein
MHASPKDSALPAILSSSAFRNSFSIHMYFVRIIVMPVGATELLGRACHEWNYSARECRESIAVDRLAGTTTAHFLSKLAVDADGSPKAYHPLDKRPPDNHSVAFDWLANINVNDLLGIQGENGAVGPNAGFHISATSLFDNRFPKNDTRRWVDAGEIPYIVLSGRSFPWPGGSVVRPGCLAFVVDTVSGHSTGAIYADVGRAVGEGSVALALRLGLRPFHPSRPPKVTGFSGKRFLYLILPNARPSPPWSADQIHSAASGAFEAWGGEQQLLSIVPDLPPLKGPVTRQPLAMPESAVPRHEIPDLEREGGRGNDVSKFELD